MVGRTERGGGVAKRQQYNASAGLCCVCFWKLTVKRLVRLNLRNVRLENFGNPSCAIITIDKLREKNECERGDDAVQNASRVFRCVARS